MGKAEGEDRDWGPRGPTIFSRYLSRLATVVRGSILRVLPVRSIRDVSPEALSRRKRNLLVRTWGIGQLVGDGGGGNRIERLRSGAEGATIEDRVSLSSLSTMRHCLGQMRCLIGPFSVKTSKVERH